MRFLFYCCCVGTVDMSGPLTGSHSFSSFAILLAMFLKPMLVPVNKKKLKTFTCLKGMVDLLIQFISVNINKIESSVTQFIITHQKSF